MSPSDDVGAPPRADYRGKAADRSAIFTIFEMCRVSGRRPNVDGCTIQYRVRGQGPPVVLTLTNRVQYEGPGSRRYDVHRSAHRGKTACAWGSGIGGPSGAHSAGSLDTGRSPTNRSDRSARTRRCGPPVRAGGDRGHLRPDRRARRRGPARIARRADGRAVQRGRVSGLRRVPHGPLRISGSSDRGLRTAPRTLSLPRTRLPGVPDAYEELDVEERGGWAEAP